MNKGWKIFLIVAGAIGGVGIILFSVGIMLGATFEELQVPYFESAYERFQSHSDGNSDEQEVNYEHVKNLECEINAGRVQFIQHSEPGIKVVSDREMKVQVNYEEADQRLNIESKRKHNRWSDDWLITIYVPENIRFEELDISLGAGNLNVDTISAERLNMRVGAGEAVIEEFDVDDLSVSCGAGSISLTSSGKLEDYNYTVSCGIGSVNIGTDDYSGLASGTNMDYNASKEIEIECGVGEVLVDFEQ